MKAINSMSYEEKKLLYRIEKGGITHIPVTLNSVFAEAIRLQRIFTSLNILSKAQFDIVNKRYLDLLKRNTEVHTSLYNLWDEFITYQIKNTPEHIEEN